MRSSPNGKNGDLLEQEFPRCRMPTDQVQISRLTIVRAQTANRDDITEVYEIGDWSANLGPYSAFCSSRPVAQACLVVCPLLRYSSNLSGQVI